MMEKKLMIIWFLPLLLLLLVERHEATSSSGDGSIPILPADTIQQVTHRLKTDQYLEPFIQELPQINKIYAYEENNGKLEPRNLTIGMYHTTMRYHPDLPPTPVFVYGTSRETATFPGPTIETIQGVPTYVTWESHLPLHHILLVDPTIPMPNTTTGVPAVVHLHGGVVAPDSDGSNSAWFTADYKEKGESWTRATYMYPNVQHPGNLLYHDHTLGLTRLNILAGLFGNYVIRNSTVESQLNLPSGDEFDRHLVIADRDFNEDGTIWMDTNGINPDVHPFWRSEYYGDLHTVNGRIWPYLRVQRRKYRFRIVNACNARYLALSLSNGQSFTVIGSDGSYLGRPVSTPNLLLGATEIYDVIIDFSKFATDEEEVEIKNSNPNILFPDLKPSEAMVMKFFLVKPQNVEDKVDDKSTIPSHIISYAGVDSDEEIARTRYITFKDHHDGSDHRTHFSINGQTFYDPVTETPKSGTTEIWYIINLTIDSHPVHIHLAYMQAVDDTYDIGELDDFTTCMENSSYDAVKCNVHGRLAGVHSTILEYEKTWKNIVKVSSGCMAKVMVKFRLVETNEIYPFDATASPGYVYHCHTLDHEDNIMSRPLKLIA